MTADSEDTARLLKTFIEMVKASHTGVMQGLALIRQENQAFQQEWRAFRAEILNDLYATSQTTALNSRRISVPAWRPIRCIFLVHTLGTWKMLAPVYKAMQLAKDFEPIVVTIPYEEEYWKRKFIKIEDAVHDGLTKLGVSHLRLNMPDSYAGLNIIKALAPDIIFRQTPWDGPYPRAYQTPALSFTRLCYMPSDDFLPPTDVVGEGREPDTALLYADKSFHQMCWRIFCATDMHLEKYARASTRGGDNLVSVGPSGKAAQNILDIIRRGLAEERGGK